MTKSSIPESQARITFLTRFDLSYLTSEATEWEAPYVTPR